MVPASAQQSGTSVGATPPLERLKTASSTYVDAWRVHASRFESDGHYAWMAGFIAGHERVLEIGVGTGASTEVLAQTHRVLGIDENPRCIEVAGDRLIAAGIDAHIELRGAARALGDRYTVDYAKPKAEWRNRVLLVEGDVMGDDALRTWLGRVGPFDAIVCWLIGAHRFRGGNTTHQQPRFESRSSQEYRLRVQNNVYLIADQFLRPGGILHCVDRGEALGAIGKADCFAAHTEQATPTSLVVESVEERLYSPPEGGVEMQLSPGLLGRVPDENTMRPALVSIVARRPH